MSLSVAAIVIAGGALLVAAISLTWQIVAFRLSGSRAEVRVGRSLLVPGGEHMADVEVFNVGRVAFSVLSCSLYFPATEEGMFMTRVLLGNPTLPATLDPGHSLTMRFPIDDVAEYARQKGLAHFEAYGRASLGTGRVATSTKTITLPWSPSKAA